MKETIQRLQILADRAKRYYWKDECGVVVKLSDVRAILEFYEKTANISEYTEQELTCKSGCMGPCGQCKDEPPNAPDITPEWDKIPERFKFVAIDARGEEYAYRAKPKINEQGFWYNVRGGSGTGFDSTNRFFGMSNIDWTKTLSKRPAK